MTFRFGGAFVCRPRAMQRVDLRNQLRSSVMKLMTIPAAALAATFVFAQSAQAREHHRHHGLHRDASRHWSRTAFPSGQRQEFGQESEQGFGQEFASGFGNSSQPETSHSGL